MATRVKHQGSSIRAAILAAAATDDGFSINGKTSGQYHCDILMKEGAIHRAFVHQKLVRYFLTKEAATAFKAANLWTPSRQITIRKEKAAGAGQAPKTILPPEGQYKKTVRLWVERNAVDVTFKRIGQPGFSMSI